MVFSPLRLFGSACGFLWPSSLSILFYLEGILFPRSWGSWYYLHLAQIKRKRAINVSTRWEKSLWER